MQTLIKKDKSNLLNSLLKFLISECECVEFLTARFKILVKDIADSVTMLKIFTALLI